MRVLLSPALQKARGLAVGVTEIVCAHAPETNDGTVAVADGLTAVAAAEGPDADADAAEIAAGAGECWTAAAAAAGLDADSAAADDANAAAAAGLDADSAAAAAANAAVASLAAADVALAADVPDAAAAYDATAAAGPNTGAAAACLRGGRGAGTGCGLAQSSAPQRSVCAPHLCQVQSQVPAKLGETERATSPNLLALVDEPNSETAARVPHPTVGRRGSEQTERERVALLALRVQTGGRQKDGRGRRWGRQTPGLQPGVAPTAKTSAALAAVQASENGQHPVCLIQAYFLYPMQKV